jgi:hypothetical protein
MTPTRLCLPLAPESEYPCHCPLLQQNALLCLLPRHLTPLPNHPAIARHAGPPPRRAPRQAPTRLHTPRTPNSAPPMPQAEQWKGKAQLLPRTCRGPAKLFVLDTNVLLHDPMCLFRFEEHDIFLPMIVLEELDGHKKGMTEVARNARQTSRSLDALAACQCGYRQWPAASTRTGHTDAGASCSSRPVAGLHAAHQPAAGQGRQPDPGCRRGAAPAARNQRQAARAREWCWCPRTSTCGSRRVPGPGHRRLPERQDTGRWRPAVRRLAGAADRFLGHARADGRELAAGRAHLLPDQWPGGAQPADQPVRVLRVAGRAQRCMPV